MRKIPALVAILFPLIFATPAFAAGYGAAGCGMGGKLIGKNNDILAQLGAFTLNGVSTNQSFAMSSGTSGCKTSGITKSESEQTRFVASNYQNLAKQMAAGEGEDLIVLAGMLGCPNDKAGHFANLTRENYDSIFASEQTTPADVLASLKHDLSADPVLSASCSNI